MGKYISLERIFEESKEGYYRTLHKSSQNWHEAKHDPFPWMEYFWGITIKAYKEFEERVIYIKDTIGGKGSKAEQIKFAIRKKIGPFSISDIEKDCPGISRDWIRYVLRGLRAEGELQSLGTGRGSKWVLTKGWGGGSADGYGDGDGSGSGAVFGSGAGDGSGSGAGFGSGAGDGDGKGDG